MDQFIRLICWRIGFSSGPRSEFDQYVSMHWAGETRWVPIWWRFWWLDGWRCRFGHEHGYQEKCEMETRR